jgi:hypothetical protein
MNMRFQSIMLSTILLLLAVQSGFAEDTAASTAVSTETDVEEATSEEADVPASQEVEVNEDNYRQFMELKDARGQRNIQPENAFKPQSGLQKLDQLPEASQKHLRNELREIIVGDPWQPGDEDTEYPYVPSAAASTDPSLQKQELEAWGELLDSYNQREAQIYANSSATKAALGSEDGTGNNPGNGTGSTGATGQSGEGSQGQQASQQSTPDQSGGAGTYSPNAANDPNAKSTAGVSQNAMEFLQGLGKGGTANPTRDPNAKSTAGASQNAMEFLKGNASQGESVGESGSGSSAASAGQREPAEGEAGEAQAEGQQTGQNEGQEDGQSDVQDAGQEDGQAGSQDDGQAQDGQQTETAQKPTPSVIPDNTSPVSSTEPDEESTAGASQNALEYLTGEGVQTGDDMNNEPETSEPEGTLTIQDLLNAQGVGASTGAVPVTSSPGAEQKPDKNKPDKDGGG